MDYIKIALNAPANYRKKDNSFIALLDVNKNYKEVALSKIHMTYEFRNIIGDDCNISYIYTKNPIKKDIKIPERYYKDDMGDLTREINTAILTDMAASGTVIPDEWIPVKLEFNLITFKINLTLGGNLILILSGNLAKYLGFESFRFNNPFNTTLTITAENKFISPELLAIESSWVPLQSSNIGNLSIIYYEDVRLLEYGDAVIINITRPIWYPIVVSQVSKMEISFYINQRQVKVDETVILEFLAK